MPYPSNTRFGANGQSTCYWAIVSVSRQFLPAGAQLA